MLFLNDKSISTVHVLRISHHISLSANHVPNLIYYTTTLFAKNTLNALFLCNNCFSYNMSASFRSL